MRNVLLLASAVGFLVTTATAQDQGKNDLDRLQGTWTVTAMTENGRSVPADAIKDVRMTVKESAYRFTGGRENYQGNLKLDPSTNPKSLDASFVDETGSEKGKAFGIYELQGDQLKLCWREKSKERPTTFASPPDSGMRLIVLKRER